MYRTIAALTAGALVSASFAVYAFAGHADDVASITGCLSTKGKLAKLKVGNAPKTPCSGTETQVHLSGGDITAVTPTRDGGLVGGAANGDAQLGLEEGFKLPQGCKEGDIPRLKNGTTWTCGHYDGTDFALSNRACAVGAVVTGIGATGTPVCGRSITSPNGAYSLAVSDIGIEVTTPAGGLFLLGDQARSTVRVFSPERLALEGDVTTLGGLSTETIIAGESVYLNGRCTNGIARKGDPVVVNPQNGVGSIVGGSTTVFGC